MENFLLHNIPFKLHTNDLISNDISQSRDFYEVEIFKLFQPFIPTEGVILDIGANIGNHSVMFALNYPNSKIYAFEPAMINFELLDFNTKTLPNIEIFKIALGSNNGLVSMNCENITNKGSFVIDSTGEKVPSMKVDTLNFSSISFLKIDVEGHEYSVIEGAAETITTQKPVIWIEDFSYDTVNYLINNFNYKIRAKGPYNNFLLVSKN
jgi:FkbM family methyltransferase